LRLEARLVCEPVHSGHQSAYLERFSWRPAASSVPPWHLGLLATPRGVRIVMNVRSGR
jgi:hypothetical protein